MNSNVLQAVVTAALPEALHIIRSLLCTAPHTNASLTWNDVPLLVLLFLPG